VVFHDQNTKRSDLQLEHVDNNEYQLWVVLIDKTKGVISNKKKRIGKLKTGFTVCRYKTSLVTKNKTKQAHPFWKRKDYLISCNASLQFNSFNEKIYFTYMFTYTCTRTNNKSKQIINLTYPELQIIFKSKG
jgi:hypothetical protein